MSETPLDITLKVVAAAAPQNHVTDGGPCWCSPMIVCAKCSQVGPCIHGPARAQVVIHNEARN